MEREWAQIRGAERIEQLGRFRGKFTRVLAVMRSLRAALATYARRYSGRRLFRLLASSGRWRQGVVLVSVLVAVPFLFNLLVAGTSKSRIFATAKAVPSRSTAIVLGAMVYSSGTPSHVLRDRLASALTLYQKGKVRKILVTGDHGTRWYDEVSAMHDWLHARGVPSRDIFLDHAGFRTFDSMARAAKVFGVEDAVICTQAFHLYRAVFLASAFGIDAVGLVSDRREYYRHYLNHIREFFARTVAVVDAYMWRRSPRYLGERIAIDGDGRVTR